MRIEIRRYKNGKLFEPIKKKFLSIRQVRHLVAVGNEILVVDTETKEDLTVMVLARVVAQEGGEGSKEIERVLHGLIRKEVDNPREALIEIIRLMNPKNSLSEGRSTALKKFCLG